MWPFTKSRKDPRSGRFVLLVECLLNQNARDQGAAEHPAATPGLVNMLLDANVGIAQIPCPEMTCLGFERRRQVGQSIRSALQDTAAQACCERLAVETANRVEDYRRNGFEMLAVLGGNAESPACAVHTSDGRDDSLDNSSGIFMLALARQLTRRGIQAPIHGMRDTEPQQLAEDLHWLRRRL